MLLSVLHGECAIQINVAIMRAFGPGQAQGGHRLFREVPEQAFSPWTTALMWRFGQAFRLA